MPASTFMYQSLVTLAQAFTLLLPITLGGITLIMCMRKGWLTKLDVPLDGGLTLGGRPLVGRSKSLRSLVIYLTVAIAVTSLLHLAAQNSNLVAEVYLNNPVMFATLSTLSYLAGEIINSFIKRRLGITTSGEPKSKMGARIQAVFDNIDGILTSGLVLIFVYGAPTELLATTFVLANATHLSTDALMRRLRLKRQQKQG